MSETGDKYKERALATAQDLEKSGQFESAIKVYLHLQDPQSAARVMAKDGRYGRAGALILSSLGVDSSEVGALDGTGRKLARIAASYLAKGGEVDEAVEVLSALGERARAAEILEQAGDLVRAEMLRSKHAGRFDAKYGADSEAGADQPEKISKEGARRLEQEGKLALAAQSYIRLKQHGEAARCFRKLNRTEEAARLYEEAGMSFDAGICFLEVGQTEKGKDNLLRILQGDEQYRTAAAYVVRVARDSETLSFRFDNFMTAFLATGPQDQRELETFYLLSKLYEKHDLLENAKETMQKLLAASPGYRDAEEILARLEQQTEVSPEVYQQIRQQESSFREASGLLPLAEMDESLPELPPLPSLSEHPTDQTDASGLAFSGDDRDSGQFDGTLPSYPMGQAPSPDEATGQGPRASRRPRSKALTETAPRHSVEQGHEEAASQTLAFAIKKVIANRYRLDAEIGAGGMATVYKAMDLELDEEIALKVFRVQIGSAKMQATCLDRFKQELKLCRQLSHPNIIKLYDIGIHQGHRYISMELLIGSNLNDLMGTPMNVEQGLNYLIQTCAGLKQAHEQGVIHRDIKPENLFITQDDVVKVMDFGIAKNIYSPGLTVAGNIAGTPEYMAPEQIEDFSSVTPVTDLYSLGIIAYLMFTGSLPFRHKELMKVLMMQVKKLPRPPRELNPDIPETLEGTILRLLAKDPAERPSSSNALAKELSAIRGRLRKGNKFIWG